MSRRHLASGHLTIKPLGWVAAAVTASGLAIGCGGGEFSEGAGGAAGASDASAGGSAGVGGTGGDDASGGTGGSSGGGSGGSSTGGTGGSTTGGTGGSGAGGTGGSGAGGTGAGGSVGCNVPADCVGFGDPVACTKAQCTDNQCETKSLCQPNQMCCQGECRQCCGDQDCLADIQHCYMPRCESGFCTPLFNCTSPDAPRCCPGLDASQAGQCHECCGAGAQDVCSYLNRSSECKIGTCSINDQVCHETNCGDAQMQCCAAGTEESQGCCLPNE